MQQGGPAALCIYNGTDVISLKLTDDFIFTLANMAAAICFTFLNQAHMSVLFKVLRKGAGRQRAMVRKMTLLYYK